MSANLVVDVGNTCQFNPSLLLTDVFSAQSGTASRQQVNSGPVVGLPVDLKNTNTFCNVLVVGGAGSGPVGIQVQTSDLISGFVASGGGLPTSGSFTDPTSGLPQMPTNFNSGGIIWINSGLFVLPGAGGLSGGTAYVNGAPQGTYPFGTHPVFTAQGAGGYNATSGGAPVFASGGGIAFAAFLRPHRFARLIVLSGASSVAPIIAGFLSNLKTTGSGGGRTFSPTSGGVTV